VLETVPQGSEFKGQHSGSGKTCCIVVVERVESSRVLLECIPKLWDRAVIASLLGVINCATFPMHCLRLVSSTVSSVPAATVTQISLHQQHRDAARGYLGKSSMVMPTLISDGNVEIVACG